MILLDAEKYELPGGIFDEIEKLVIIIGLGGKTGTKYIESAAKSAVDAGVRYVHVIATLPFVFEGNNRINLASSAAQKLTDINGVNITILNNEELLAKYPDLNLFNAFEAADKEAMQIIEDVL